MQNYINDITTFLLLHKTNILLTLVILLIIIVSLLSYNCNSGQKGGEKSKNTFVLYYVDWCPHCRTVKPEWNKLEKDLELNKKFTIKKIDCEKNKSVMEEKGIESFPTILLTSNGKEKGYNGGREYNDFKKYLESLKL